MFPINQQRATIVRTLTERRSHRIQHGELLKAIQGLPPFAGTSDPEYAAAIAIGECVQTDVLFVDREASPPCYVRNAMHPIWRSPDGVSEAMPLHAPEAQTPPVLSIGLA